MIETTYRCNLCRERIDPLSEAGEGAVAIFFTGETWNGKFIFRPLTDKEALAAHLCRPCLDRLYVLLDEKEEEKPAQVAVMKERK